MTRPSTAPADALREDWRIGSDERLLSAVYDAVAEFLDPELPDQNVIVALRAALASPNGPASDAAPAWLWYGEDGNGEQHISFGRWQKHPCQHRYKYAAIQPTEHDHTVAGPASDVAGALIAEQFIRAAIDTAPEPLRRLGRYMAEILDEDRWKTAERMLLGAASLQASGEKRDGWQPIETAPKGKKVLLRFEPPFSNLNEDGIVTGTACVDGGWWLSSIWAASLAHKEPTHWQPLPPPPATAGSTENGR